MALQDPAPHIKDLITVYKNMPYSLNRDIVVEALQRAYLYATSDELAKLTNNKQEDTNGRYKSGR